MFKISHRCLNYFFIGPPGSRKRAIAARLAADTPNFVHIDTNRDILSQSWNISRAEKIKEIGNSDFINAESETTREYLQKQLSPGKYNLGLKCHTKTLKNLTLLADSSVISYLIPSLIGLVLQKLE